MFDKRTVGAQRAALLVMLLLALTGCGRGKAQMTDLRIVLRTGEGNVQVGVAALTVSVTDAGGQPVEDAAVRLEGNMTHAGMVPVMATASGGQGGEYQAQFDWSMSGDWIVTVTATLADGRQAQADFPVRVMEP